MSQRVAVCGNGSGNDCGGGAMSAYTDAAIRGELSNLAGATNGGRNNMLFKVAARVYEFVAAGELAECEADDLLWRETTHAGRPCLAFPTATGTRYRYLDGQEPRYHSPAGYTRSWYRLSEAVDLARDTDQPIVLCNGEASVVAAQFCNVAAFAVAGGSEKPSIPDNLLAELREQWDGAIIVAFDCDKTGRSSTSQIAAQLKDAGYPIHAVDLHGGPGFDLADFCRLHDDAVSALAELSELSPTAAPTDSPADSRRFSIGTEDELMALPPLRYLDRELGIVAGGIHLLYGASGSGKTFFAIERAMRQVALGRRVLYIATEDQQGLRYRVAAWRKAYPAAEGRLTWLKMPDGLDLQDHHQVAELLDAIAPYQYDHIVLDTLREAHSGDENSSQDTARINRALQRLAAADAAIDVAHHSGVAGERPRGSTALFGNADVVIKIENDDGLVHIHFDKLRNAPPRDSLAFGLVQQDTGLTDSDGLPVVSAILRPASQVTTRDAAPTPMQRKILEALALSIFQDTGARTRQLVEAAGLPENKSLYRALSALKTNTYIRQTTKGEPYYITPEGRAQLGPALTVVGDGDGPTVTQGRLPQAATVIPDAASESPTVTPVTPLSPTVRQDADLPLSLSVTVTTLRGDSDRQLGQTVGRRGQVEEVDLPDDLPAVLPVPVPEVADVIARLRQRQKESS